MTITSFGGRRCLRTEYLAVGARFTTGGSDWAPGPGLPVRQMADVASVPPMDDCAHGNGGRHAMSRLRIRPHVLDVMTGAWSGQAVYVAAKLGIVDRLADGPQSVDSLAHATEVNADALYRVLRALASIGIFRVSEERIVELTPLAKPLGSQHPDSLRNFAIMANEELYEAFADLPYTMRTGSPAFDRRFGMAVDEYFDEHPEAAATFHEAMSEWSRWDIGDILGSYDFSRFDRVVDVGGGTGAFLSALLTSCPNLSGVLLDRDTGIEAARNGLGGPLPRCELVVGDFLTAVPEGADLYVIKHVMDGYPDAEVVQLLRNCRTSMVDGGRVVALESVIEPGNDPSFIKWVDVMIMAVTPARFRTAREFAPLFAAAGLRLSQVVKVSDSVSLLEGRAE
jgi:hypothetical protein